MRNLFVRTFAAAVLFFLFVSCSNPVKRVIRGYGSGSDGYDVQAKPYAVFDFDNTSIAGDISLALLVYAIDNLEFKMPPESMYPAFLNCVPDIDRSLDGFEGVSARMLATDLYSDYSWLYDNYISNRKLSLDEVHESEQFRDFRAKLWALSLGVDNTFGSEKVGCLWILRPFSGMTADELKALTLRAVKNEIRISKLREEKWTSPGTGEAGKVSVTVPRGMAIGGNVLSMYRDIQENGIDVYICSASSEIVVEALACSEEYFGLPEDKVFGIRLSSGNFISPDAVYLPSYPVTYAEGKSELIRSRIAPSHGGREPLMVGGDSNGDFSMLTSFPDMKLGIIVDMPRSGAIDSLKRNGGKPYYVRPYARLYK